jgi:hypothetical protein
MSSPSNPPPTRTVIERLGALLGGILLDVSGRVSWGGISMPLNVLVGRLIIGHRERIYRIVDRIRAGTYVFRRRRPATGAGPPKPRPPRPPGLIRQSFGWVLPLLPPYWSANGYSAGLESLLADPEMVALIEAAPVSLGRPLRSLCWMFRVRPPPVLAPPRRAARPAPSPRPELPPTAPGDASSQVLPPVSVPSGPPPPASPPPPSPPRHAAFAPTSGACGPPQTA